MGYHDGKSNRSNRSTPSGRNRSRNTRTRQQQSNQRMNRQGMTPTPCPPGTHPMPDGNCMPNNDPSMRGMSGRSTPVGTGTGNQTMGKRSRGRGKTVRNPRKSRARGARGNGNGNGNVNRTMSRRNNLSVYNPGENNQVLTCYCVNPGPTGYCSGGCSTGGSCTSSSQCSSGGTGSGDCSSNALMWCAIIGACIAVGAYCGSNQFCFIAGTKVKMTDGTEKNIEDVEVSDKVVSWNEDTGKIETSTVKTLKQPIHDDMVILEWEHGTTTSTFDHPYYSVVKQDWTSYKPELTLTRYDFDNVGQLQVSTPDNPVGDIGLFMDKDKNLVESKLLSIKEDIGEVQTYIFELEGNNTFFANGILTHNKSGGGGASTKINRGRPPS